MDSIVIPFQPDPNKMFEIFQANTDRALNVACDPVGDAEKRRAEQSEFLLALGKKLPGKTRFLQRAETKRLILEHQIPVGQSLSLIHI